MSNNRLRSICAMGLLLMIWFQAPVAIACGPFSIDAVFTFSAHPEFPLENFARGELGVVQPSFARSYLVVAYRYLKEADFNQTEQQALLQLWRERLESTWSEGDQEWIQGWLTARAKVPGIGAAPKIEVYRFREKPNQYEGYLNCQKDTFETAAATLEARIQQLGLDSAGVKQWVEAQDQVFANCSEGQHLPAALPAESDALMRADRQYQIAAANFYSGNFDEARNIFRAISADEQSPWHLTAPYLEARTLLRKGSLGAPETKKEPLAESEDKLNRILKDPKLKSTHAAARRLLSTVRIRLHPEARLNELGGSLADRTEEGNLKQDLWDYTLLLDQFEGDDDSGQPSAAAPAAFLRQDDLTDWITSFQSNSAEALAHSLDRWQSTSAVPWLIAALAKVDAQHAKAEQLQKDAAKIPPTSAAFPSASFHTIRLDIEAGRVAEARTKLDSLLNKYRSRFHRSDVNLFLHLRMRASNTLDDFVSYSHRLPAGLTSDEDGRELPSDPSEPSDEPKSLFDADAGAVLNLGMPVALLSEIGGNKHLPPHLRRDVVQAAWLRSVLLADYKTANSLVPELKALVPEMAPLLDDFLQTRAPDAKTFSAIYIWLKFPGMEPVIDIGLGRGSALGEQDSYRDNWWCHAAFQKTPEESQKAAAAISALSPTFLTAAQRAAAQQEYATLARFGAAPNYLSREVLAWATRNPSDTRVPEALHRVVQSTRYGCTDKQTGRWSKAAHDFLHRRYPNNAWTKKTPYWFKD
jgi:hypothetical protein